MTRSVFEMLGAAAALHDVLAKSSPKLTRGKVWCTSCGRTEKIDSADCLRHGWPKCCGYTMTIDSPEERKALVRSPAGGTGGKGEG